MAAACIVCLNFPAGYELDVTLKQGSAHTEVCACLSASCSVVKVRYSDRMTECGAQTDSTC